MGKGCITVTKYFLFLFNLLFFIFGALIMGFGLWVLLDNQSFIAVLQGPAVPSSPSSTLNSFLEEHHNSYLFKWKFPWKPPKELF